MTSDTATPVAVTEDAAPPTVGWHWIVALGAAVLAALSSYAVGVLLPYFVNGLHRLPLAEVTDGSHDPEGLWPRGPWAVVLQLTGYSSLAFGPVIVLLAVGISGAWLAWLWRRPGPQRVPKSLVLLAVMAASVAELVFMISPTGAALSTWRLE